MKRPDGTLVQRSQEPVFVAGGKGYIINQKNAGGLQAQFNAQGFREVFEGGGYLQVTNADPASISFDDFLADPAELGHIEEHTSHYHLIIDQHEGHCSETRNDGTRLHWYPKKGVSMIVYKDGLEIQLQQDGHTLQKSPDGTITQQNPDGSVIEAHFNGSKTHYQADGRVVEQMPGEYVRLTELDGTVRTRHADGTLTVRRPDGEFFRYNSDNVLVQHAGKDGGDLLAAAAAKAADAGAGSEDTSAASAVAAQLEAEHMDGMAVEVSKKPEADRLVKVRGRGLVLAREGGERLRLAGWLADWLAGWLGV